METTTWQVYAPFGIGLDSIFNRLDAMSGHNTNYPPYNIVKNDEANYEIEIALAGFKAEEIEVSTEQNILRVASKVAKRDSERTYLHKGLSKRSFNNSWQLADEVRVSSVDFADGLLTISLEKVIPEHQKRTTYTIGAGKPQLLTE
jgi:molecular chaperone IbpA